MRCELQGSGIEDSFTFDEHVFRCSLDGAELSAISVTGPDDETIDVQRLKKNEFGYTASEPGVYEIQVTLSKKIELTVPEATVKGSAIVGGAAGHSASFVINTGIRRGGNADSINIEVEDPEGDSIEVGKLNDKRDGTYTGGVFKPKIPGWYKISVTTWGRHASGSPFTSLFQAASAENCIAEGPGIDSNAVVQGKSVPFLIHARDSNGKPILEGPSAFAVQIKGPSGRAVGCSVQEEAGQKYRAKYTPLESGPHEITVLLYGKPLASSPYRVVVQPRRHGSVASSASTSGSSSRSGSVSQSDSESLPGPGKRGRSGSPSGPRKRHHVVHERSRHEPIKVIVIGLPPNMEESEIIRVFEKYGPVDHVEKTREGVILEVAHPEIAFRIQQGMHGVVLGEGKEGRPLVIEPRPPRRRMIPPPRPGDPYFGPYPPPPPNWVVRRARSIDRYRGGPPPLRPYPSRYMSPRRHSRSPPYPSRRGYPRSWERDRSRDKHRDRDRERRRSRSRGGDKDRERERERGRERSKTRNSEKTGRLKNFRIILEDLPGDVEWTTIKDWGRDAGLKVEYTQVLGDGRGVIEFSDQREYDKACEVLIDRPIKGKKVPMKCEGDKGPIPRPRNGGNQKRDKSASPEKERGNSRSKSPQKQGND